MSQGYDIDDALTNYVHNYKDEDLHKLCDELDREDAAEEMMTQAAIEHGNKMLFKEIKTWEKNQMFAKPVKLKKPFKMRLKEFFEKLLYTFDNGNT